VRSTWQAAMSLDQRAAAWATGRAACYRPSE
jgi:hypothetical protein